MGCANYFAAHIDPYPSEEELLEYYEAGYLEMDFLGTSEENSDHLLHYSEEYEPIVFKNYSLSLLDSKISKEYLQNICHLGPWMRQWKVF